MGFAVSLRKPTGFASQKMILHIRRTTDIGPRVPETPFRPKQELRPYWQTKERG
jgi:hypothetical protein